MSKKLLKRLGFKKAAKIKQDNRKQTEKFVDDYLNAETNPPKGYYPFF